MAVRAIKTEARCKLCSHAKRAEIDTLLELRSQGKKDAQGRRYNLEYVLELLAGMGVENPTEENVKNHWKKHCLVITEQQQERDEEVEREREKLAEEIFVRVLGEDWRGRTPTPEQYLELVRALSVHDLFLAVREGNAVGITVDQGLKSVGESTKRKQNEAQAELLGTLSGGLSMVFEKALNGGAQKALPAGEEPTVIVIEDAVVEEA